jgi:NADPH:quinone reductase-like Zn-dependent oxidoreductase
MAEGLFPGLKEGALGCDVSGTVSKIGPETETTLKVGDQVYGDIIETKGAFGEYALASHSVLAKKPSNISMEQAAALPLAGLTAWQGLITYGKMKEGDKVLIFGGSGGVGSLAIQMALALGASEVYATGSDVEMIKGFGADTVINYKEESLMDALKGKDFDVVYDTIGGYEHWEIAQKSMKSSGGNYVTIVGDGTSFPMTFLSTIWRKLSAKVFGGPQYNIFLADASAPAVVNDMKTITELVENGSVKPVLDKQRFQLTTEGIHDMMKASKSHRAKGKLVLKVV